MSHQFQEARIGSLAAPEGQSIIHQDAQIAARQGALQVTTTGGTVSIDAPVIRCAPAGAVTGVIMPVASRQGEQVVLINVSAAGDTITMAAAGTSHVANGTSSVIAGLEAAHFIAAYDDAVPPVLLWYGVTQS